MLAVSKYCLTFTTAELIHQGTSPFKSGLFLCPLNKGGGDSRGAKNPSSGEEFSSVNATALFVGDNLKYIVMLNNSPSSESSPMPCQARSIINKLLLTDNLDDLRHRLSRDFMTLLTGENDELERNRMLSDFNTLDLVLKTIEKERE